MLNRKSKMNQIEPAIPNSEKSERQDTLSFLVKHKKKLATLALIASSTAVFGAATHHTVEQNRADDAEMSAMLDGADFKGVEDARQHAVEEWKISDTVKGLIDATEKGSDRGAKTEEHREVERAVDDSIYAQIGAAGVAASTFGLAGAIFVESRYSSSNAKKQVAKKRIF